MTDKAIRTRFAPSPTGMFHVGGARSALFNWALALQQPEGKFVLRIEDTDAARNRPEWTEGILRALSALGIDERDPHFEGPYFQSAYADKHREVAEELYRKGRAYYCDCTREQIQERRGNPHLGYDGYCRDRGLEPGPGRALRFRVPEGGPTVVDDKIRGRVEFDHSAIEDFVIARSDGSPLFVLANVVDDVEMAITHVVRGEEHLSNTPKQQLLWEALGQTPPVWAHLPVIVNEKRQKLSKRRDKVALEDYLAEGYLPEAMVNYLMLLGWGPGDDREIMPFSEMVPLFRLEDVNSSSAFFDEKKLRAFNGEYIRALDTTEFVERCAPWLGSEKAPWPAENFDAQVFEAVAPLAQTRISVLSEIVSYVDFLFLDRPVEDEKSWAKAMKPGVGEEMLTAALERFSDPNLEWRAEPLKAALEEVAAAQGLKLGKAQAPVRVAVTGRTVGLPLFESLELLGRSRVQERLRAALEKLKAAGE
ncbi:glutamate--tRNA ligase [Thermobifida fusca]|uniref:Glutamate--tRNA ligase n=2 Tax=Thermobifida fusca TaxID=2021 RepID=SYE_THEFY|nr:MULTISPECIES: glutamate--tRNA ligase [Thermobifida]Q47SA6.1 RecName: Full=Glutamate--tRNA ligase; AltName: Full=Glutamyl-tRNA synthetase; Short=GluRS [Thermobifida fusca YX]AAZ54661.1 glutamyl-tRNA synthetase [Thermobifida fusca YX]MBO2529480.1 glutamate--tRNA ligase [Thermobifida sp.]MDD6793344.1 glutamate--tRNA ligase [Thermobifida fusca]PZN66816.1 MAG: glutamate--tRNA ligase [Thermobifida fusca]QOS60189.1 glutamate--tRNA ligase [Thermobifida fusca]